MRRYSLSRRLLAIVTGIAIVAALIVPFAGILNEYYVAKRLIHDQTRAVHTSTLPVLAHLVWTVNQAQTEQLLRGVVAQPAITAAVLHSDGKSSFQVESEQWDSARDASVSWPVVYPREDTVYELGHLQIWTRSPWAMAWSAEPLGLGLLIGLVVVGLLSAGISAIIRHTVTSPLVRLAADVQALTSTGSLPPQWRRGIETDRGKETFQIRLALDRAISTRLETEQRLAASLQEKEVLLQEIHHRVKNNLQIISSLLSLQRGSVTDPNSQEALDDSRNRVLSMAIVHELLHQGSSADTVPLRDYLKNLSSALDPSALQNIVVSVDAPAAPVTIDTAIPMGLVVTELVTNAMKHAFRGLQGGRITVSGLLEAQDSLRITVADDGVGLPQDWSVESTDSLGMRIVTALTSQLGTELTVETGPGTRLSFVVPTATSGSEREDESAGHTPD